MNLRHLFIPMILMQACGQAPVNNPSTSSPQLIGGERDNAEKYSPTVVIKFTGNKRCTGVVVDDHSILTAGHCLADDSGQIRSSYHNLEFAISNKVVRDITDTSQWFKSKADSIDVHPNFAISSETCAEGDGWCSYNDMGIITFDKTLPKSWKRASHSHEFVYL